jgi:hypothetical protein
VSRAGVQLWWLGLASMVLALVFTASSIGTNLATGRAWGTLVNGLSIGVASIGLQVLWRSRPWRRP